MSIRPWLAAAVALSLIVAAPRVHAGQSPTPMTADRADRPRVAIFFERGFPSIDAIAPDIDAIALRLQRFDLAILDASALQAALDEARVGVLVLPFGSAFPQAAWPSIFRYLSRGGSFVNLGGVPFAAPVVRDGHRWRPGTRTASYHKQLGIVQAFPVAASALRFEPAADDDAAVRALARDTRARRIFELVARFTSTKAFPDEDGSDGPREARLAPLVHGFDEGHLPVAAPFVQIDRLEGTFAGGRWLLATGDLGVAPDSAASLIARASTGAIDLRVQPRYAGFHRGEAVTVAVTLTRPLPPALPAAGVEVELSVADETGQAVASDRMGLVTTAPSGTRHSWDVPLRLDSTTLKAGLYRVTASAGGVAATSGFWIYDSSMLRGGRRLTVARDYFIRDGTAFPITGTTYMTSDVHRRFLLEPNAWAWQRDFTAMGRAGVNLVRTGIWTGWSMHAEPDGQPTESMLRALDVFLLTARRHDVPVIFTFFAFVPPAWGGRNPYFDPQSVGAQKRFVAAIAGRLAGADDIAWDLINEPSFSAPDRLWQCRPNYDEDEQAAWAAWLRETVAAPDDVGREAALHDRWNSVPGDGLSLPAPADFRDAALFGDARPNKAADYRRFAQQAFRRWAGDIASAIRGKNAAHLITVGQDEGGTGERPSPLLFGDVVDFTGTHTWWNNDALLWDALMSKRADRPSLVEETGVMTSERPEGLPWRTEDDARNLLERKIALAFAGGAAGFVQWLWNTNVYMPSDNEAGIGFLRADGTAKPEIEPFLQAAAFVRANREGFGDRAVADAAVIVPQSALFSVRNHATEATQRAVRTLEYALRLPVRVMSEYALDDLRGARRLLVLPSPRLFTQGAWNAALAAVEAGATLLVTGPIDRDEYERPVPRLASLGIEAITRPVAAENHLYLNASANIRVPFRGTAIERIESGARAGGGRARLEIVSRGKGRIVWCPLPVELSEDDAATAAVYRVAMRLARVRPAVAVTPDRPGVLVRALHFAEATLLVAVNECNTDADLRVQVEGIARPIRLAVAAERAQMLWVEKRTGRVIRRLHE